MAITTGHDHNIGLYCKLIPRRTVLEVVALLVFLRYVGEVLTWVIFAQDLYDRDRHQGEHCFGIRCPSPFSCPYQHETTLLVRYAIEVLVGTVCALVGFLGALNWNSNQLRVFATYLLLLAGLSFVVGLADFTYTEVCGSYPANIVASMPIHGMVHGGRDRAAELHMVGTTAVDEIFGYHLTGWYLGWTAVCVAASLFFANEAYQASEYFATGPVGLYPNFKIADGFGFLHADRRVDLRRLHYTEPVGGYGTIPDCYDHAA